MKNKYKIDILQYPENAANKFSFLRLIIYTIISLILTILMIVSSIGYQGKALLFSLIIIFLIAGYTILNIIALIKKIKDK